MYLQYYINQERNGMLTMDYCTQLANTPCLARFRTSGQCQGQL